MLFVTELLQSLGNGHANEREPRRNRSQQSKIDWITLLFVVPPAVILHYGVILREERYLTAKFGEPYLQYKREVRRWI